MEILKGDRIRYSGWEYIVLRRPNWARKIGIVFAMRVPPEGKPEVTQEFLWLPVEGSVVVKAVKGKIRRGVFPQSKAS